VGNESLIAKNARYAMASRGSRRHAPKAPDKSLPRRADFQVPLHGGFQPPSLASSRTPLSWRDSRQLPRSDISRALGPRDPRQCRGGESSGRDSCDVSLRSGLADSASSLGIANEGCRSDDQVSLNSWMSRGVELKSLAVAHKIVKEVRTNSVATMSDMNGWYRGSDSCFAPRTMGRE